MRQRTYASARLLVSPLIRLDASLSNAMIPP